MYQGAAAVIWCRILRGVNLTAVQCRPRDNALLLVRSLEARRLNMEIGCGPGWINKREASGGPADPAE